MATIYVVIRKYMILIFVLFSFYRNKMPIEDKTDKPVYVKPRIDKMGLFRKGQVRNSVNTSKKMSSKIKTAPVIITRQEEITGVNILIVLILIKS